MKELFYDIPSSVTWASIELVDKGWSSDKKYHVITESNNHLLLRVSDISTYENKVQEFEILEKLSKLNLAMSNPYVFGTCSQGVYMLLDWVEGEDMEQSLGELSLIKQYELGLEAGFILKDIHDVDIDIEPFSWEEKFNAKIDSKIKKYTECPLQYDNGQIFIDYLESSRYLLKDRPIMFHHGDYHCGNMILTPDKHVGIIDFNRYDHGDPWEEFNRIVWDIQTSPAFAAGRIDGYFNNDIPKDFFKLLALYIASNCLSSLPWAIPFGEKEVQVMKNQAEYILKYFDFFDFEIPSWYKNIKNEIKEVENYETN